MLDSFRVNYNNNFGSSYSSMLTVSHLLGRFLVWGHYKETMLPNYHSQQFGKYLHGSQGVMDS